MKVEATAINRADILQVKGMYPPPKGSTEVMGLEASGYLEGESQENRICALLSGGGYGRYAFNIHLFSVAEVHKDHLFSIPSNLSFAEGASIVESSLTSYLGLIELGKLQSSENILIYAGASGIGTTAIQMSKALKTNVITIAGTTEKCELTNSLGSDLSLNYKELNNDEMKRKIMDFTNGKGVDIIFDCIGASFVELVYFFLILVNKCFGIRF